MTAKKRTRATKPSEALEVAKEFLLEPGEQAGERYRVRFICSALYDAQEKGRISATLKIRTIRYIMRALYPSPTLCSWLARRVSGGQDQVSRDNWVEANRDAIQAHRWAWVDRMIADLQRKGR